MQAAQHGLEIVDKAVQIALFLRFHNLHQYDPYRALGGMPRAHRRRRDVLLKPAGLLYLYEPYKRDGAHTAPSNEAFEASLRACNPEWGVCAMEDVANIAVMRGFRWEDGVSMPGGNFSLVFRRS